MSRHTLAAELREDKQPSPQARRGSPFEKDGSSMPEYQPRSPLGRIASLRTRRRQLCDSVCFLCNAIFTERTYFALWLGTCADCRTKVHESLGIGLYADY